MLNGSGLSNLIDSSNVQFKKETSVVRRSKNNSWVFGRNGKHLGLMLVLCLAVTTQIGKNGEMEKARSITKRNGFVPLITSSLELDKIRKNTMEELCLKYANININETCPVCICHQSDFDIDNSELGCMDQCSKDLYSSKSEFSFKPKGKVMGSLGFDKMQKDSEDLRVMKNTNSLKQSNKKGNRVKIVGDLNEEELMNIMDDELPHAEETMYLCEKMDPTQLGPDMFNFGVNSSELDSDKQNLIYTAEKLKTG